MTLWYNARYYKWGFTRVLRGLLKLVTVYPVMLVCAIPHGLYVACQIIITRLDDWWIK